MSLAASANGASIEDMIGFAEERTFDDAERYHLAEDRWERLPPMPTARHGLDAAAGWRGPSTSSPVARKPASPFPASTSG